MEIPDVFLRLNHEKSPCLVHEKHIVNTAGAVLVVLTSRFLVPIEAMKPWLNSAIEPWLTSQTHPPHFLCKNCLCFRPQFQGISPQFIWAEIW